MHITTPEFDFKFFNEYDQPLLKWSIVNQILKVELSKQNIKLEFSLEYQVCADLWTGVKELENTLETREIHNEGEISEFDDEAEFIESNKALILEIEMPLID